VFGRQAPAVSRGLWETHYPVITPSCILKVSNNPISPLVAMCLYEYSPSAVLSEKQSFMDALKTIHREPTDGFLWWLMWVYHVFRQLDAEWIHCFRDGMIHSTRPVTQLMGSVMLHHMGLEQTTSGQF
jgi:hypothetical protein